MISHYCRRLHDINLIKIISEVNFKKVVAKIFIKKERGINVQNQRKINKQLGKIVELKPIESENSIEE